jgi:hypothetical protein
MFTITISCKSASYYALKSYYLEIDNYSTIAARRCNCSSSSLVAEGAVGHIKSDSQALHSYASRQRMNSTEWVEQGQGSPDGKTVSRGQPRSTLIAEEIKCPCNWRNLIHQEF